MLPLLRQRLDAPSLSLGLSAAAYMVFVLLRLRAHGYDPSYFVTAGDQFVDVARAPGSLSILKNSSGYDGQFYYRLALDPFTGRQTDFGITLDLPETRQSRIVYPLLVWLLSPGRVRCPL